MSNWDAGITWFMANATTKALPRKCPGVIGDISIYSSYWAQSFFCSMGFSPRGKTSAKVDIPEAARKEIEYLFLYEIISKEYEDAIPL